MKLLHSDLKPENICMETKDDPHSPMRLIDFSMASFFGTPMDPGGTPEFVAPELLNEPELYAQYGCGPSVDMWSAGIILYFLLSGQTPFSGSTVDAIVQKVQLGLISEGPKSAFRGASWSDVSDGAVDLIRGLLRTKGQERLTAREALSHPWIQAGSRMGLPRKSLELARKMFRSQALQAGEDVSSSFPPVLYSPSSASASGSPASSPSNPHGLARSQSERSSYNRDSRQKGLPLSTLTPVLEQPHQPMSTALNSSLNFPSTQPSSSRPAQRYSTSGSILGNQQAPLQQSSFLSQANQILLARGSQSSRHDVSVGKLLD
jgi:serine/threonine protein kinase